MGSLLALGTCNQPVISLPPTIMTYCPKLGGKSLVAEPPGIGPAQITSMIKTEKCSLKKKEGGWVHGWEIFE